MTIGPFPVGSDGVASGWVQAHLTPDRNGPFLIFRVQRGATKALAPLPYSPWGLPWTDRSKCRVVCRVVSCLQSKVRVLVQTRTVY